MTKWYDSEDPGVVARGATWRFALWIIGVLLFVALISGLVWGFKVATSDIRGQGNAVMQKNDATNRINKQEMFEQMYADIKADDDKIQAATDAYKRDKSYTNEVNLTGVVQHCQQAVQDYNAEARKYTAADFRSTDLPAEIGDLDPATDCQPDNK